MVAMNHSLKGNYAGCNALRAIANKAVFVETFGCTYNHGDTRKLTEVVKSQGCRIVDSPDLADVVVVNSCMVIEKTSRKVLKSIASFRSKELYVTGCMPVVEPGRINDISHAILIPPDCIHALFGELSGVTSGSPGIVQIARGCRGRCTYCVTRLARGDLVSFPKEEIIREVEGNVRSGAAEIQLTAQDASSWGIDRNETLPDLLWDLTGIEGNFRIRIGMMNPATLGPIVAGLSEVMRDKILFNFIHMPIQSGSDRILDLMGRGYRVEDTIAIMDAIRREHPEVSLMTDMIVGFPGENDEDFQSSLSLIRKIRPNKVNITRYSARPGTRSAGLPDLTDSIKKNRSRMMNAAAETVYRDINSKWQGKVLPFIVTEKLKEGSVVTRSPSYLAIIQNEDLPIGTTGHVRITDARTYYLVGTRVM
jgi:threonylcarbamoyladenosine tRNA methylthiotransferase CDKAL1